MAAIAAANGLQVGERLALPEGMGGLRVAAAGGVVNGFYDLSLVGKNLP